MFTAISVTMPAMSLLTVSSVLTMLVAPLRGISTSTTTTTRKHSTQRITAKPLSKHLLKISTIWTRPRHHLHLRRRHPHLLPLTSTPNFQIGFFAYCFFILKSKNFLLTLFFSIIIIIIIILHHHHRRTFTTNNINELPLKCEKLTR